MRWAILLLFVPEAAVAAELDEVRAAVAALVDLPPAGRPAAAKGLAKRLDLEPGALAAALRTFGRFGEDPERGTHGHSVALHVAGKTEQTLLSVYVPQSYDPSRPAPLLAVFHGSGGDGRDLPRQWSATAEALGMLVVAPSEIGDNAGYSYSERERLAALAAIRWVRRHFNVDETRIHLTGYSRGGHLTWDLALRHPGRFASLSPMVGGPRLEIRGGQNNLRFLRNVVDVPIRDLQGSKDHPLLLYNLRWAFERLQQMGARDAKLIEFPELGHSCDPSAVDWTEFLGGAERAPAPAQVALACAGPGMRSAWVEVLATDRSVRHSFKPQVDPRKWARLDDKAKRRHLQRLVDERTAWLEVTRTAPGRFVAKSEHVKRFRIYLTEGSFDPTKPVEVRFGNRVVRRRVKPDLRVLLEHFAERFDRTLLPVAALTVP